MAKFIACTLGMQIPFSNYTEISKEEIIRQVGEILKDLCRQRGIEFLEGTLKPDHIHMCLSIPPKFSVAFAIGFLKGKSAIRIHRYLLKNKQTKGKHFWSRGYCVSTVGLDEQTIRKYIRDQEEYEKQQLDFDFE